MDNFRAATRFGASNARGGEISPPPEHVSIVGLGPSALAYVALVNRLGSRCAYSDETWGINAIGDTIRCDRLFHMDDLRVQEARAKRAPLSNIANMLAWMPAFDGPIYTSRIRDGYPNLIEFPLKAVLNNPRVCPTRTPYFNSTGAYAVAYAIHIGVSRISLFGMDYTLPNAHSAERGRACVEYWIGIANAVGIEVTVPEQTSLLDACAPESELLYGFDCTEVQIDRNESGGVTVQMTDRPEPVDAEAIERRYDHTRHPNRLMDETGA